MAKTTEDAKNFILELISLLGAKIDTAQIVDDIDSGITTIAISTPDGRILIGRDGEFLSSLNALLHRYMETGLPADHVPVSVSVDINEFEKKRIDILKTKAHMMAERAKFFKSSIELDPMNGYERRIIHTYLEKDKNIQTESTGEGKERRIVVMYKETE